MHIHILGICGTFMAGVARLACELGYKVTGTDRAVYPPMSTQLAQLGVEIDTDPIAGLLEKPDMVIVGNALTRGHPAVEYLIEQHIPYYSGPEWLDRFVLRAHNRPFFWTIAASGTHGKTTTASMIAWILDYAKLNPSFLIGGVPGNFDYSARLGDTPFFVVEADEYDTAFFDKRSKFVHYHPKTLTINNLEYDHADIFNDLESIQRQFHHLIRTIPQSGLVIYPEHHAAINKVIQQGCWSEKMTVLSQQAQWQIKNKCTDFSCFSVQHQQQEVGVIEWGLCGEHNQQNALFALLAARHIGVPIHIGIEALSTFILPKRRLERLTAPENSLVIYDDFAHHPTAIQSTLSGLRAKYRSNKIIVIVELASNTMRGGHHQNLLAKSLTHADSVLFLLPSIMSWDFNIVLQELHHKAKAFTQMERLTADLVKQLAPGTQIIIMSNGSLGGKKKTLVEAVLKVEATINHQ